MYIILNYTARCTHYSAVCSSQYALRNCVYKHLFNPAMGTSQNAIVKLNIQFSDVTHKGSLESG